MSVLPLNWPDKVDSPELLAWLQQSGIEKYIDATQINSIRDALNELYFSSNPDRIISLGTETIDGNEHTYEDYTWQLGGVQVNNIGNPSIIVIPSATVGFKRKDISVFTPTGTIERVAGTETDGEVVTSPDVPEGTLYYKSYDIDGDTIEVDPEPPAIDGSIYKKKIENTRWKSTQSGTNVVIPFQAAGQSHYSVVHSGLISVAGFSTAALTTPMYEGQDVLFENQTGNPITLKDSFGGVNTPFDLGADLVVPNEGKIWFRSRNGKLELIMKSWSDPLDLSAFDDVVEGYKSGANFYEDALHTILITPEIDKLYISISENKAYRWSGSTYVQLSAGIDFPTSDNILYGVKNGIATQIDSELHKNWHSIVARKESAGNLVINANAANYASSGTVSVITAPGISRRATFWFTNWLSATTAGALAGIRQQNSSETSLRSGYEAYFIFGNNDTNVNAQSIIGFTSLIADFPNVDFSAYTGSFHGIGNEVGDANLSLIVKTVLDAPNSVAASYTKIPLGSSFPAHNTTDVYLAILEAPQTEVRANQFIKMTITNLINGATTSHIFESSLCPFLSSNVCFKFQRSARNSGIATNIALLKYLFKPKHY